MCSAPHVSAGVKIVLFFVFAALVRVVVWPDAICWTNDSGDVRRQVIVNDVTGENFVLETTLNKSSSAYRVPMQVCIRSDVSNLFCQSTSFVQDNLCFGFGRFFVVWIVQCLNGLALTAGYAFVLWKRSNGVITQVDLAIPIILLAFTLTVIWLHISLMSSWMFLWWRSGWVAPTIPYSEALVCGLCAVAILSEVFDLIVLCRAFRNKLTKQCSRQNQLGLSYAGMIVVAMRNSDTRINSRFFDRALTIKDLYAFLQTHIVAIQKLDKKEWNKTQRIDDAGTGRIVPSKQQGADKGGLWTLHPAEGESEVAAEKRINKLFKGEHCDVFGKQLVNRLLLNDLLTGNLGWKDAEMKPLDSSEAKRKVSSTNYPSVQVSSPPPPSMPIQPLPAPAFEMPLQYQQFPVIEMPMQYQQFPAFQMPSTSAALPPPTFRIEAPEPKTTSEPKKKSKRPVGPVGEVVFVNVVGTADMHLPRKLELHKVAPQVPNAEYDQQKHNSLRMKIKNPDATALVFSSGKIVVTGLKSVEQCREAARRVAKIFKKLGFAPKGIEKDFRITNVVATVDLGFKVDLSAFGSRHAGRCTYDPELFSAATYELRDGPQKLTLNVFSNGKVNIVGGKSEQQVLDGFERMRPLFDEFNPAAVVSAPEPVESSPAEASTPLADIEPEFEFDPATFDFGEDPEPPLFVFDDEQEAPLPQDNFYEPLAIFSQSYQFHDNYADFTASLEPCPDNFSPYTFY